jgi:hypothetical protein
MDASAVRAARFVAAKAVPARVWRGDSALMRAAASFLNSSHACGGSSVALVAGTGRHSGPNRCMDAVVDELHGTVAVECVDSAGVLAAGCD